MHAIKGELAKLGITVSATATRTILRRYGLGPALAGADIAAVRSSRGGTSKAEIGVASSSARSRPRVARQYLGESSR